MKNRFGQSRSSLGRWIAYWLPIAAFVGLFILFLSGIRSVGDTAESKQLESLETALHRSIAQCYAVEGRYPASLDYLKEHYGLSYDESKFLIDYESFGGNLIPEVTVLRKTGR